MTGNLALGVLVGPLGTGDKLVKNNCKMGGGNRNTQKHLCDDLWWDRWNICNTGGAGTCTTKMSRF